MNWHCTIRDMSKYDLVRLIEKYDNYIKELNYVNVKTIEEFVNEDCAELEL